MSAYKEHDGDHCRLFSLCSRLFVVVVFQLVALFPELTQLKYVGLEISCCGESEQLVAVQKKLIVSSCSSVTDLSLLCYFLILIETRLSTIATCLSQHICHTA